MDKRTLTRKVLPGILFLFALGVELATFPPWDTLSYDGALYIDIARNLAVSPTNFTYQGVYVMYRPPLYPYTLSLFYHFVHEPLSQLRVARLVSVVFFALTAVLVYLLTLELFERFVKGILASAFFIFNALAFTMGTRELVHSEFTFFYTLAIYLLYTGRKRGSPTRIYLAFVSAGLAILTRYTGLSIIAVFVAYLWLTEYWNWVKKREYWIGFALLLLTVSPWLYLGHLHYGGVLKPFEIASRTVTADRPVSVSTFLKWLVDDIGAVLPALALLGFVRQKQDEKGWLLISWALIGFAMIMTVTHKETRFITFLAPVMGILAVEGVSLIVDGIEKALELAGRPIKPWKKAITIGLALLLLIPVGGSAFHLKERWNTTGKCESHTLRYASERYSARTLLVSPTLYTIAGFYYPRARVDAITSRINVEDRLKHGYYDMVITKTESEEHLVEESGGYRQVGEFCGRFKIFIKEGFGAN
ncbi:glycosyltransferase family 39 protein [Thermococcus sp. 21S9]|uniref:ArnT family glycosyltransferase n=1 Tax=Thermococcus sp. 21S9 TaxID=1638223 RepID=UPI00143B73E1|nr:glycosyltransferase family 39 protein [Thermococcus sp. 21S9]NJE54968.1 glycosyltransferase family 39 protein [Thermococcus sp. 21S9]